MARIRSIKPEFWTSDQVTDVSPLARLAFIGMWNFCDDYGVHKASAKTLKRELFPDDNISAQAVLDYVGELIAVGLVEQVEDENGEELWRVTGWPKHQRIDHPSKPRYSGVRGRESSRGFDEGSRSARRGLAPDRKGGEGKGIESKGNDQSKDACAEPASPPSAPSPVFITIPVVGSGIGEAEVTDAMVSEWEPVYPGVDVRQQLRHMREWCVSNPAKRKTARGLRRFITAWLAREQDRGGGTGPPTRAPPQRSSTGRFWDNLREVARETNQ